ncbi:MAG TPA: hypothetical protein VFW07_11670 [Parafilimonas sp.]|nr:hypothetical protein [Parafilimonas sp.]
MKIKIILIATFFAFTTLAAYSQTSDAETEALVNLLGVQKKEAMAKLVSVSAKDSATFWKIYDDYQQNNKETAKYRIRLYERTAQSYSNMSPAVADSLAMAYFANRDDQEKMLEDYYEKIKASTNAVTAFEFYQAEIYMITQIRAQIMQQIPTYGQLKNSIIKK